MSEPYAYVQCWGDEDEESSCGSVPISEEEYLSQMRDPFRLWRCPRCENDAGFDDEKFEAMHPGIYAEDDDDA